MAPVKWDTVSGYINDALSMNGRIERAPIVALAEMDDADDDIIDALDAVGSRVFESSSDVRDFLVTQGYVVD